MRTHVPCCADRDFDSAIPLVNLGFIYLFALLVQFIGDRGFKDAILATWAILASIPLTLAKMKQHQYYAHRGIALGLAQYLATGRDLATKRTSFKNTFERYSFSHLAPACDLIVLLLIFKWYSALGNQFYINATQSLWLVVVGWLFAPALYNPFSFSLAEIRRDFREWTTFLRSTAFDDFHYGQKAGAVDGDLKQNNWYSWLNVEPTHLKLLHALFRLVIYYCLFYVILMRITYVPSLQVDQRTVEDRWAQAFAAVALVILFAAASRVEQAVLQLSLVYVVFGIVVASVLVQTPNVMAASIPLFLALYCLGKTLGATLELLLLCWSAIPDGTALGKPVASQDKLLLPRTCHLLAWRGVLMVARLHAELQAGIFFGVSAALAVVLSIPLALLVLLLLIGLTVTLLSGNNAIDLEAGLESVMGDADAQQADSGASATLLTVLKALAVLLLAVAALVVLGKSRRRLHAQHHWRFQLLTLSLNSVHHWLLMSAGVSSFLAETAAAEFDSVAPGALPPKEASVSFRV